jgi:uncharacterized protein with GYD domain
MSRYLIQAAYTAEAMAAFVSKPQDRVAGVRSIIERLGGEFEHLDFCLGEYDVVATYSAPDDTTAAALALAVVSAGHLKTFKTTRLLSPEEFLDAQRKASGLNYQAPTQG